MSDVPVLLWLGASLTQMIQFTAINPHIPTPGRHLRFESATNEQLSFVKILVSKDIGYINLETID